MNRAFTSSSSDLLALAAIASVLVSFCVVVHFKFTSSSSDLLALAAIASVLVSFCVVVHFKQNNFISSKINDHGKQIEISRLKDTTLFYQKILSISPKTFLYRKLVCKIVLSTSPHKIFTHLELFSFLASKSGLIKVPSLLFYVKLITVVTIINYLFPLYPYQHTECTPGAQGSERKTSIQR